MFSTKELLPLKSGSVLYLFAPGFPFDESLLQQAIVRLESYGWRVHLPTATLKPSYFHAQSDAMRAQLLLQGLSHARYQAVWAIRGGYGANRLWPYLQKASRQLLKQKPKWILGLSDVTSLHLYFNLQLKWPTWHVPVVEAWGRSAFEVTKQDHLVACLKGDIRQWQYPLTPLNQKAQKFKAKKITGGLVGGNLTVIQSHLGMVMPAIGSHGLFLEDVGERGYRIDRMLFQLQYSGQLKKVPALFLGEFTGGQDPDGVSRVDLAWQRFAQQEQWPIFAGIPSGHGEGYGFVPFGVPSLVQDQKLICTW